jgi:putative chitinase
MAATGAGFQAASYWTTAINEAMIVWGIAKRTHQAAFLAQIGHESSGLAYSTEIWGPSQVPAQRTYEGRADLGNTQPGDGYRFRGHGLIQVTGRANHRAATIAMRALMPNCPDFEADPDALARAPWAVHSACWFWHSRNLGQWVDAGDFVTLTRRINGGINGLDDRRTRWAGAKSALGVA